MDRETIFLALGMIQGAAFAAQRNIRDVILDATELLLQELGKDKEEEKEK